jgi:hypothetical protein
MTPHPTTSPAAIAVALCCALLAGCALQDSTGAAERIAVANAALTDALSTDASRYAGGDVESSRKALIDAGTAMSNGQYERARLLALEAETDANLARARTGAAKAQVAANEIKESTRLLRNEPVRSGQ